MHADKRIAEVRVGVLVKGIEVRAHGAGEQDRVLGDDGQAGAQGMQVDCGDVEAVDVDAALAGLEEAEEGERQGRLAGTGAADDADAFVRRDAEVEVVQDGGQVRSVGYREVGDLEAAFGRPVGGGLGAGLRFRGQGAVLQDAFCSVHVEFKIRVEADGPDDAVCVLESEAECEAGETRVDAVHEQDEDGDEGSEEAADERHADAHPAVEGPEVPEGGRVVVNAGVHTGDVDGGLGEGADG